LFLRFLTLLLLVAFPHGLAHFLFNCALSVFDCLLGCRLFCVPWTDFALFFFVVGVVSLEILGVK
jgi:hypothetical protein